MLISARSIWIASWYPIICYISALLYWGSTCTFMLLQASAMLKLSNVYHRTVRSLGLLWVWVSVIGEVDILQQRWQKQSLVSEWWLGILQYFLQESVLPASCGMLCQACSWSRRWWITYAVLEVCQRDNALLSLLTLAFRPSARTVCHELLLLGTLISWAVTLCIKKMAARFFSKTTVCVLIFEVT